VRRTILLAFGVAAFVALAAVAGTKGAMPGLVFSGVHVPTRTADQLRTIVSAEARWQGRRFPITLQPLAHSGDAFGDGVFGGVVDRSGQPIAAPGGPMVCNSLDGATLLQAEGALWSIVHGECQPAALQLSRVAQDPDSGHLTLSSSAPIDLAAVGGGSLFCAAEDTDWSSHLAAEEYDVDASAVLPDGTLADDYEGYNALAAYHGGSLQGVSPYDHAWIDEVAILDADGATLVTRRTAMGRFSHELARVLPDGRTVYLSDDSRNGGFFLFVADVAGDLSVGRLYAARWGTGPAGALGALTWVPLGRASEAQIAPWLARGATFDDLMERADPTGDACPEGFGSTNTTWGHECLRVRPGAELAASRLETRRYAALRGATTEFSKTEGIAFDPKTPRLFVAISRVERGMLAAEPIWDAGGPDDVGLEPNPCGLVLSMGLGTAVDSEGAAIDSALVAGRVDVLLAGAPKAYAGALQHNTCDVDGIAGPDNLEWVPGAELLLVAEDTAGHENNALWAFDPERGALTRILTVPFGAEVAGLQWYPDVGGRGYITVSVQEPFSVRGEPRWAGLVDGQDPRSWTGWLGPFPKL
jgi:secreted PhoX family phosphatase